MKLKRTYGSAAQQRTAARLIDAIRQDSDYWPGRLAIAVTHRADGLHVSTCGRQPTPHLCGSCRASEAEANRCCRYWAACYIVAADGGSVFDHVNDIWLPADLIEAWLSPPPPEGWPPEIEERLADCFREDWVPYTTTTL